MSKFDVKESTLEWISRDIKIWFVVAEFNLKYTEKLLSENKNYMLWKGFHLFDTYRVPWAFEIPGMVKKVIETWDYELVIALWVVVRGETTHYEIITQESARGLMDISLNFDTPIINGILTCENFDQVDERMNPNFAISWLKLLETCMPLL